jgi:iron complex outermembrane receptor protein
MLHDIEAGVAKRTANVLRGATLYYMFYKDQLVLQGMLNDVGAYTGLMFQIVIAWELN